MNKQELIDKLASLVGSIEDFKGISTFHDGKYAGLEHALELIQQLDEPEFNDYLCDIKSQIEYLRIHGPGKIKSLRMLQNMVDNMITGCWSSTSIRTQKVKARLAKHWDEDLGDCLWWDFPVEEPPYCGTPLDDDFPKYKTHFTELHIPDEVEKEPLYHVKLTIPGATYYLIQTFLMPGYTHMCFSAATERYGAKWKNTFTESEIKAIDERFWLFAVPVDEVVEG
ncbi:DUF1642 domain-containing protein [Enterococcus sp. VV15]|uniref:DUF1642 domain-containing protein n=1 Tax=Enterococcus sp. VV15 TaxID=2233541 RepID=UPI001EE8BD93|nr:DUF1642 domain-containing protein [Enterococcus sp. VV15]